MLLKVAWKNRIADADALRRLMDTFAKFEADLPSMSALERLCWYIDADGGSGYSVFQVADADVAAAFVLESAVAFGEQLEIECRPVLDMEAAVGAIAKGLERLA
jgi:hypothetical protein